MADNSKIEWTDATWNPTTGCSVVSPGCTNCYAMKLAGTRMKHHPSRAGLTTSSKAGPVWNGEVRFNEDWLFQPLQWGRPRKIFVVAHGDLFHESVPDEWIDRIFAVMALSHRHVFQVLTKRSDRMRAYLADGAQERIAIQAHALAARFPRAAPQSVWPLPNVWLGVSIEDQAHADARVDDLLASPATIRWVSAEPLLGPLDLMRVRARNGRLFNALSSRPEVNPFGAALDWVVSGGESGPGARPSRVEWHRELRDQCEFEKVAFTFKQYGDWGPDLGCPKGRDLIFAGEARCAVWMGDRWAYYESGYAPPVRAGIGEWVYHLGKLKTGRLLDGRLHDAEPHIPNPMDRAA